MRNILGRCPRCRESLFDERPIRTCARCHGHWIPEDLLHERIVEMRADRVHRPVDWHAEARIALKCAACNEPMDTLILLDVPVDRCLSHGVWFDKGELETVLLRSTDKPPETPIVVQQPPPRPQAMTTVNEVDPFTTAVVVEAAAEVVFAAPELVVEVASTGLLEGLLDGLVEVIGGLFL